MPTNESTKTFKVLVVYQENFEFAAATALAVELGLGRPGVLDFFNRFYFKENFISFCAKELRDQPNITDQNRAIAKEGGSVIIPFEVPINTLNLIAECLNNIVVKIAERISEKEYISLTRDVNKFYGSRKMDVEATGDILRGLKKILAGFWDGSISPIGSDNFKKGWNNFWNGLKGAGIGFSKIGLQMPIDGLIMEAGRIINSYQSLLGLESVGRMLNSAERIHLMSIFGGSLNYDVIRIKEGYAGLLNAGKNHNEFSWTGNNRPLAITNTIYMKDTSPDRWQRILAHETTHVWQFQHGGTDYMCEALYAQSYGEGYYFANAIFKRKSVWAALNPEQQAELIELAFVNGYFQNGQWSNTEAVEHPDFSPNSQNFLPKEFMTNYMNTVIPQLRAGIGAT